MTLYHPRPERWPQFSLRGLLVAVTLAALVTAWGVAEYRKWQAAHQPVNDLGPTYLGPDDAWRQPGRPPR